MSSLADVELRGWDDSERESVEEAAEWEVALKSIRDAVPRPAGSGPSRPSPAPPRPERKFQDPADFVLLPIVDVAGRLRAKPGISPRKRRHEPPAREKTGERAQRDSQPIPSNIAIEEAARPYVERFELRRGGHLVDRQAALVGADFVADDGRYIEVKATGGTAEDAFDLQESEWSAALDPRLRDDYWVYIVEHLTDEGEPTVTAVFNPVRDDNLDQSPVGKMRVTGWRSARRQQRGSFKRIAD